MRIVFFVLLLVLCPAVLMAETAPVVEPVFSGFHFGDAPGGNMLCTAGPCATGLIASGYRNSRHQVAIYKTPVAATHVDGVEISPPGYFFHENRLFQIAFRIVCDQDMAEVCMTRLSDAFNERYGMTRINQIFDSSSPGEARLQQNFRTSAGYRVEICRYQEDGQWRQPLVNIYQPTLMDAVRLAANPNYHADVN
ncbi:MAG: hypothetical protein A2X84_04210 [Desulfuromonadaceae bacterium GWC2_58_13]|nr:MAG: hypothetical protein A2X84_04210 [Desulfuromonadaceae bacterium GWC2_58_13]